jgi:mono/diheme cytochrome c family protein
MKDWFPMLALSAFLLCACSDGGGAADDAAGGVAATPTGGDPVKGRKIYELNCIACHTADPGHDGALGPAVAGASRELLEERILRGSYPAGYTPKRGTRNMAPLPHLAPVIPDLAAYLAAPKS